MSEVQQPEPAQPPLRGRSSSSAAVASPRTSGASVVADSSVATSPRLALLRSTIEAVTSLEKPNPLMATPALASPVSLSPAPGGSAADKERRKEDRLSKGPIAAVAVQKSAYRKSSSSGTVSASGSPRLDSASSGSPRSTSPRTERISTSPKSARASLLVQNGNPLMSTSPRLDDEAMAMSLSGQDGGHRKSASISISQAASASNRLSSASTCAASSPEGARVAAPQSAAFAAPFPVAVVSPQPVAAALSPQPVSAVSPQPVAVAPPKLLRAASAERLNNSGSSIAPVRRQESRDHLSRAGGNSMVGSGGGGAIASLLTRSMQLDSNSGRLSRKGSVAQPLDEAGKARVEGDLMMKKKKPLEAIEHYGKAITLQPEVPVHYVNRAVAYIKVENYGAAVADCDTALNFDPLFAPAFARKAKALLAQNRNDEAAVCFEKARAIDPKLKELKKMNLADMRTLRQGLKNKQSNSNLRNGSTSARGQSMPENFMSPRPPSVLFGVSLEELMAQQKSTYPELAVPEVVLYLMDRLSETGGLKSEGIFRLSIGSVELQTQLAKLGNGRRDLDTRDPNAYAVILKHFYRHLPDPLCANFEACMAVVHDYALHDTSASLRRRKDMSPLLSVFSESTLDLLEAVWTGMPVHARNAAMVLFRLFDTLLVPENAKATKMSLDNLALVFSNGVLRDPDPSALSALASQPSCQRFVTHLYTYVMETQCGSQRGLSFPLVNPSFRMRSPVSSSDTAESPASTPLTNSFEETMGGASAAAGANGSISAANKRAALSGPALGLLRSSDEHFRAGETGPHQKKGSVDDPFLLRLKSKKSSSAGIGMEVYSTWSEFFESAGLPPATAGQYGLAFEREKLDVNSAMEIFGGKNENGDVFKTLGMKSSHVSKAVKFVRLQKSGSLGGRSTLRSTGRASPTGISASPPGSARTAGHANTSNDNDFTGLI